jgi:3'-phosphoadenosine 5'-phosphosulfate sulfotransferase (PAPS reductase)/FAD synthetase
VSKSDGLSLWTETKTDLSFVPDLTDYQPIVSFSGGKDSVATALALIEHGIEARHVFADTGWEADSTVDYVHEISEKLGLDVAVVGTTPPELEPWAEELVEAAEKRLGRKFGALPRGMLYRGGSPLRIGRWCTIEYKLRPIKNYHLRVQEETDLDTVNVIGVRAEESVSRAAKERWYFDSQWDGQMWLPIHHWRTDDVLRIHQRHDIPVNPLYTMGHNRVGCYPCILARKDEIALIAKLAPEHIEMVRELETLFHAIRSRRNEEQPGRYGKENPAFFEAVIERNSSKGSAKIDEVVDWARTDRKGHKVRLAQLPPGGGCFRWGLCETHQEDEMPDRESIAATLNEAFGGSGD